MEDTRRRSARLSAMNKVSQYTPGPSKRRKSRVFGDSDEEAKHDTSISDSTDENEDSSDVDDALEESSEISETSEDDYDSAEDSSAKKRKGKGKARPAKRAKYRHTPNNILSTELAFFRNKKEQRARIQGFPLMSLPLDIVFEVCTSGLILSFI
jgi:hypothetical protein